MPLAVSDVYTCNECHVMSAGNVNYLQYLHMRADILKFDIIIDFNYIVLMLDYETFICLCKLSQILMYTS